MDWPCHMTGWLALLYRSKLLRLRQEIRRMASDAAQSRDPVRRRRVSEVRDEWTEEDRAHCQNFYDDIEETREVQAERVRRQRTSGDRRVALQEREVTITEDRVLRARGRVPRNKANGPADRLETEMLQCLPTETAYEVTHWFDKRFKGECRAPEAWKVDGTVTIRFFVASLDVKTAFNVAKPPAVSKMLP